MANTEVRLIISADGSAAIAGVEKVTGSLRKMESESGSLMGKIKSHWLGLSAAAYSAFETISKGWDLAEKAAQYNEQMHLISGLASQYGVSAQSIVDNITEVSDGMISMSTAAQVSVAGLSKGLRPEMLTGLAEAARILKETMGETTEGAFQKMAAGIELNREKTIKLALGAFDLKERYGDLADKMSEAEKQTALYNLIMEKAHEVQKLTGESSKSMADKMETLKVTVQDAELVAGQLTLRLGLGLAGAFNIVAAAAFVLQAAFWKVVESGERLIALFTFGNAKTKMLEFAAAASTAANIAYSSAGKQIGNGIDNFKAAFASAEDFSKAMAKTNPITHPNLKGAGTGGALTDWTRELAKLQGDYMKQDEADIAKRYATEKEVSDKIRELTVDEFEVKRLKAMEWYQKEAAIIGDTPQLYKALQFELTKIDSEALDERLKNEKVARDSWLDDMGAMADQFNTLDMAAKAGALPTLLTFIDKLRETGDIGSEAFLKLTGTAKKYGEELEKEKVKQLTFSEGFNAGIAEYIKQLEDMGKQGADAARRITEALDYGFDNMLDSATNGFKDFGKVATAILQDVLKEMLKISMTKMMGGKSIGGLIMSLLGFGGSGSSGSLTSGPSGGADLVDMFPNLSLSGGGLASGGPASSYTPYLVGEKGPEIFMPRTSGMIIPNNKLAMAGSSISISVPITINGKATNTKKMISDMRSEMEKTALEVIRRHS